MINKQLSTADRVVACLSYLSILFLPVVFPLIVWIVGHDNNEIAHHAKRAFWSQLFPAIYVILSLLVYFSLGAAGMYHMRAVGGWLFGILLVLALLVSLVLYVYNIAMGIAVLIKRV